MKVKLSDICDYVKGKVLIAELSNVTYISTENMLPNKSGITTASSLPSQESTQLYEVNDVLVSNIRPYFKKIWQAEWNGGCSNDVLVFRAKKNINARYLYYVLSDDRFFEFSMATSKGTKMPRGDKAAIMEYEVELPEYKIQEKIVSILNDIDSKIKINNKLNLNLEQQGYALFVDKFIKNKNDNWVQGTLSDIGTIIGGGTPSKAKTEFYCKNGLAWITPKDLSINKNKFVSHGENDITEIGLKNSSAVMMPRGTVLFSSRAPIGYIAISKNEVSTNQGFKSVIPNSNVGTPFVYYFLKHYLPVIENMASGSTFKEVSGSVMKSFSAIIPDEKTMMEFNNICYSLFDKQEQLESENNILISVRETLLKKLLLGEIDLTDIDI